MLAAAALTVLFSEAVAEKHERDDLRRRHGSAWLAYRRQVRRWLPRWRPAVANTATLYLDLGCDPCRELDGVIRRVDAGYALLGWVARMPGLSWLVAWLAAAHGLGPRPAGSESGLPSDPGRPADPG